MKRTAVTLATLLTFTLSACAPFGDTETATPQELPEPPRAETAQADGDNALLQAILNKEIPPTRQEMIEAEAQAEAEAAAQAQAEAEAAAQAQAEAEAAAQAQAEAEAAAQAEAEAAAQAQAEANAAAQAAESTLAGDWVHTIPDPDGISVLMYQLQFDPYTKEMLFMAGWVSSEMAFMSVGHYEVLEKISSSEFLVHFDIDESILGDGGEIWVDGVYEISFDGIMQLRYVSGDLLFGEGRMQAGNWYRFDPAPNHYEP